MGVSKNTLDRSAISVHPIKLKYTATYYSSSANSYGITVNRGVNTSYNSSSVEFLNYALMKQLYYQGYITGSLLSSASYWDSDLQSTAASGTFDSDNRYFPTGSGNEITIVAIPRTAFGENISRNSLSISGNGYTLIDDGNGNLLNTYFTSSVQSDNVEYTTDGVKLYSPGYSTDGTGTYISWNTVAGGGSYSGTFWTNPVSASKTGRLNYTGLWSAQSLYYVGSGQLTFNINVPADATYYVGLGCDNYASLYIDNSLVLTQVIPDAGSSGANFKYWHIYPVNLTSGDHTIKFIGNNIGVPTPSNPGSMGIEVYNNTYAEISASISASPNGPSVPSGLNIIYSSKDNLTAGVFGEYTHVGNVIYSQGIIVITNSDYKNALIP